MEGSINIDTFLQSSDYRDAMRKGLNKIDLSSKDDKKRLNVIEQIEHQNLKALTRNVKEAAIVVIGMISGVYYSLLMRQPIKRGLNFSDNYDSHLVQSILAKIELSQLRILLEKLIFGAETDQHGKAIIYTFKDLIRDLKMIRRPKELAGYQSVFQMK